jgi:hypothetical protein
MFGSMASGGGHLVSGGTTPPVVSGSVVLVSGSVEVPGVVVVPGSLGSFVVVAAVVGSLGSLVIVAGSVGTPLVGGIVELADISPSVTPVGPTPGPIDVPDPSGMTHRFEKQSSPEKQALSMHGPVSCPGSPDAEPPPPQAARERTMAYIHAADTR